MMNMTEARSGSGATPEPQSKQGHAWLPPQIVQSHPAIQLLPAKAPTDRQSQCVVYFCSHHVETTDLLYMQEKL